MQKINTFIKFIIIVITFIAFASSTSAEQMLIDVSPVFPNNQDPEVKSYLSLTTDEPYVTQEVEFLITNRSKEEVTIKMEALNALNSPQKGIQYTTNIEESNTRLLDERYALAHYIDIDEQVTVKGGEEKRIRAKIDIPELEGTILGAIGFKTIGMSEKTNDNQFMIHNELNRIIGVQIDAQKGKDNPTEFVVHDPYIEPMAAYYAIRLPLAWDASLLLKDVYLTYEVFDSEGKLLFESKEEQPFNIAPNTETAFSLPWQDDTVEENKEYVIKGELNYGGESFLFNKSFDFNEAQAMKQGNNGHLSKPEIIKDDSSSVLFAVAILISSGVIVYLFNRRKHLKKHFDEK